MVFNKNAVMKISRISNSKSPPQNLVKFRSEFLGKCLKNSALNFFEFDCELMGNYKNTWFLR